MCNSKCVHTSVVSSFSFWQLTQLEWHKHQRGRQPDMRVLILKILSFGWVQTPMERFLQLGSHPPLTWPVYRCQTCFWLWSWRMKWPLTLLFTHAILRSLNSFIGRATLTYVSSTLVEVFVLQYRHQKKPITALQGWCSPAPSSSNWLRAKERRLLCGCWRPTNTETQKVWWVSSEGVAGGFCSDWVTPQDSSQRQSVNPSWE